MTTNPGTPATAAPQGVLARVRSALAAVRDGVDGWLHPFRRARARARLRSLAPVDSIVFACLGNVCRSPYAEAALRARIDGGPIRGVPIRVESIGFMAEGRPPPDVAISVARERGIDQSGHRSRKGDLAAIQAASVVFVFDREHLRRLERSGFRSLQRVIRLGDLDPIWPGKRPIWDPWNRPESAFRATFDRIDRCLDVVVEELRGGPGDPD